MRPFSGALLSLVLSAAWPGTSHALAPLLDMAAVSSGWRHTCALTKAGGVLCWGLNDKGHLGDNSTTQRLTPVEVAGLGSGVTAIAVGFEHTCALTTAGGVKCWGRNDLGQLGDNSTLHRLAPVAVSGLGSGVQAIATGHHHSCALTTSGGVKCWGNNQFSQLVPGTSTNRLAPVDVTGLTSGVAAIRAGFAHTCALTIGGGVKCWGNNTYGQLGASTPSPPNFADVTGLTSGVKAISAGGQHNCALTMAGGVKCWGDNTYGGIGDGTTTLRATPVDVSGLTSGVSAISAGNYHSCALTTAGGVRCWGYNGFGQLGDNTIAQRPLPISVTGLSSGASAVSAGIDHTCALTTAGGVKCWGSNFNGELGDGTTTGRLTAVDVGGFGSGGASVSTTTSHALALDVNGKVYGWGGDTYGQLGQGRSIMRLAPTRVPGLAGITHIALSWHALAVDAYKQVWAWGSSDFGKLGARETAVTTKPSRVIGMNDVTRVAAGRTFSLALKTDGTVWGWGTLPGHGSDTGIRQIPGLTGIVEIAAGYYHALARRGDGTVFAFGENSSGQLGLGTTGAAQAVTQVPGLSGATAIAAGMTSSMVLLGSGQVQFWGTHYDQTVHTSPFTLANPGGAVVAISDTEDLPYVARADGSILGYRASSATWAADFPGFAGIAQVTSTGVRIPSLFLVLGISSSGQVYTAGANNFGQLGHGDTVARSTATAVAGITGAKMLATGGPSPNVLALKADGTVWFWGADHSGYAGDGKPSETTVPLAVPIAATVRAIATGARFSAALDSSGTVWGWGDNNFGPLDTSLVSRSAPAVIPGISGVQAIASGKAGCAFILYLKPDGTVWKSGTFYSGESSLAPAPVPGLTGIVGLEGGDCVAYAIDNAGRVYAWGSNFSGELGNGSTGGTNAIPAQVIGIAGSVVRLSAGHGRASAVTGDGKVWSWGEAPLGNGASGGSATPVQVTGITDAVDVAVLSQGTLVRRQNGSVLAWGTVGLRDATGQNLLQPYPVAFHEPIQAIAAGAWNNTGYFIGKTGLLWGFGTMGPNRGVGDGTSVVHDRPVVIRAPGGAGSIDSGNWYLDLDPSTPETIPASSIPTSLGISQLFGTGTDLSVSATVNYKTADLGKSVNNYVIGLVPPAFFSLVKTAPGTSSGARLLAKAKDTGGFVLANLTSAGWTDVNGQLLAYSQGTANAAGGAVSILNGINSSLIPGARFCIGYGESSSSMLDARSLTEVLSVEGAAATASGVPCVLTGIYVDGPPLSRAGSSVTFNSSVVGISPTGTVQFQDGTADLLSPVTLAASNAAVAKGSISTATLALGVHSLGAKYSGNAQNAAVSTEIPLRHEVVNVAPGSTTTTLSGPTSSAQASEATFSVTVAGDHPSGTVQFRDGSANLGDAVPLVGGIATLRTSALGLGAHAISATYSGDGANATSTSLPLTHTVFGAITTTITLASSSGSSTVGASVTFTARVTGSDPTGNVIFRDGATVLATVALVNGVASLTVTNFDAGQHVITAEYAGDANDPAATSAAVFQLVSYAGTTFDANVRAIVTGYYRTILGREPDAAGLDFWAAEATRVTGLGADVREVFFAMSIAFFASSEYVGRNTTDTQYVTDLYRTFFVREPDAAGLAYWLGELAAIGSRSALLNSFLFSAEFSNQMTTRFGTSSVRPEVNMAIDLFRGVFGRLPDSSGFGYWLGRLRTAQCQGASAVSAEVNTIAGLFFNGDEYLARGRSNRDFVGDVYNAYLRRGPGGDASGFNFWTSQLSSQSRDQVRAAFVPSAEFQARVSAVVAAGCLSR